MATITGGHHLDDVDTIVEAMGSAEVEPVGTKPKAGGSSLEEDVVWP